MAARRTKSRVAGRTTGPARSGNKACALHSEVRAEQEAAVKRGAHEDRVAMATPFIGAPFYSDALRAWRVECIIADLRFPGGTWQSSFFTKERNDAAKLQLVALNTVEGKEGWQKVREQARVLAESQQEGHIAHMNRTC